MDTAVIPWLLFFSIGEDNDMAAAEFNMVFATSSNSLELKPVRGGVPEFMIFAIHLQPVGSMNFMNPGKTRQRIFPFSLLTWVTPISLTLKFISTLH
ncbi:MAG: hypothetical protein A2351_08805 [Omnitrophica bacterium RIFOXYB12_FULL_50_7]|nr:MAG: hypothetical protein A2351_08805 [Omnitrophica bacterium RIFOXYB12_FULL_50_7]